MEFWINIAVIVVLAAAGWVLSILTGNATMVAGTGTELVGVEANATTTTLSNSKVLEIVAFVDCMGLRLVGFGKMIHPPS